MRVTKLFQCFSGQRLPEVPASRRLPLHHEGQHGAPEPGASLAQLLALPSSDFAELSRDIPLQMSF